MRLFGFEITRKATVPVTDLTPLASRGWFNLISEPFTGAWQRNMEISNQSVLAHNAVYACVTLIAQDISKMNVRIVEKNANGIWNEVSVPAFSPVLRKPNHYQNRIQFFEQWVVSKLLHGNTYVLLKRDGRDVVDAMYVLDPRRTRPTVADNGDIYYNLNKDNLSGIEEQSVLVPASEIIHDTMTPLFHPLCGVSPLIACGIAAMQGLSIQGSSTRFFQNGAMPGGILSAPDHIEDDTAQRLKKHWEENYTGANAGRIAVLGDGLKFERMVMSSEESQLIEQLKWTAENICSCFKVPPYMIGLGPYPSNDNVEASNQRYYSQCLQSPIECIELSLDEGLGIGDGVPVGNHIYGTEFDLDGLLRMDTATQYKTIGEGIGAGLLAPNEGRKKISLPPVEGGDTPYLQQQNYSLSALNKRDTSDDPFASSSKTNTQQVAPPPEDIPEPPPAKLFSEDEFEREAEFQIAAWSLRDALEKLAA